MTTESTAPPLGDILVVDDLPANLELLADMLGSEGFKVRPVPTGDLALRAAHRVPPDLILLDINMPGMNGYEVCERLKRDALLKSIPVIFISALGETTDKIWGFKVGGVDYVTKPFQFEEVLARVRTHLELSRLRRELERQNERLESTVARRTRELAEAKARLAILDEAKSDFLSLISHEVRTPLNGILGVVELMLSVSQDAAVAEYSKVYEESRRRLMTLIDDALLLSEVGAGVDGGTVQQCALSTVLEEARAEAEAFAASRDVRIAPVPAKLGLVRGSPAYLVRAMQSLIETAVKFARAGETVRLTTTVASGTVTLTIEADGLAVPPDVLPQFFDLLTVAQAITPGGDLGLGPPLAERIVSIYGGTVSVANLDPAGIRLVVELRVIESGGA
jgi:DNA-binding response OmpR family regulator